MVLIFLKYFVKNVFLNTVLKELILFLSIWAILYARSISRNMLYHSDYPIKFIHEDQHKSYNVVLQINARIKTHKCFPRK